jgi:hypothetical protein
VWVLILVGLRKARWSVNMLSIAKYKVSMSSIRKRASFRYQCPDTFLVVSSLVTCGLQSRCPRRGRYVRMRSTATCMHDLFRNQILRWKYSQSPQPPHLLRTTASPVTSVRHCREDFILQPSLPINHCNQHHPSLDCCIYALF